jgi:hypothetical protein
MVRHLLVVATLLGAQTAEPAPDFAIRLDHKGCHYEYLDTFKGTYSHVDAKSPVSFVLSPEQRMTIFAAVMAARSFDLPRTTSAATNEPADNYEIEIRNAGKQHTVAYVAGSGVQSPIWDVHQAVFKILEGHPDVLRLPRRGDGCFGGPPSIRSRRTFRPSPIACRPAGQPRSGSRPA